MCNFTLILRLRAVLHFYSDHSRKATAKLCKSYANCTRRNWGEGEQSSCNVLRTLLPQQLLFKNAQIQIYNARKLRHLHKSLAEQNYGKYSRRSDIFEI